MSSAVELGVSLALGAGKAAARSWEGADPAAAVRGEESVFWAVLWLSVAVLRALVPGVWVGSDWSGDSAVVVLAAVWEVAALDCSAACELDGLRVPTGLGVPVDAIAVAVGGGGGPVVDAGLAAAAVEPAAPAGAPSTPRAEDEVGVDPVAGEEPEPPEEEVVADEAPESGVTDEALGLAGYAPVSEEIRADEAPAPAGGAVADVEVSASTGEEAGSEGGNVPTAGEPVGEGGSVSAVGEPVGEGRSVLAVGEPVGEGGSVLAAELEPGTPAEAEVSPDGGMAAASVSGVNVSVAVGGAASAVVLSLSVAAAGLLSRAVAEAAAVSGLEAPEFGAGGVTIPLSAVPAALVRAGVPLTLAAREWRGTLSAPPLGLFL